MNYHINNHAFQIFKLKGGFYRKKTKIDLSKCKFTIEGIFLPWTLN